MTRPQLQPNLLFYAQTLFCAKHEDITPDISWHRWNLTCKGASGPVTYKIVCSSAKQHRRVENVSSAHFPFKLVSVSSREYMKTEVSADWFAYNTQNNTLRRFVYFTPENMHGHEQQSRETIDFDVLSIHCRAYIDFKSAKVNQGQGVFIPVYFRVPFQLQNKLNSIERQTGASLELIL